MSIGSPMMPTMAQPLAQAAAAQQQPVASAPAGMSPQMALIIQKMAQAPQSQGNMGGLSANMLAQAILQAQYKNAAQQQLANQAGITPGGIAADQSAMANPGAADQFLGAGSS